METVTTLGEVALSGLWERQAAVVGAMGARAPGHDTHRRFHRDRFLELLRRIPLFLHIRAVANGVSSDG